jgi:hypothetical protein
MFSRKKIAAVSGLLGGLALTCTGVAQVHAAVGPGTCSVDAQGNITCVQRISGEKAEDGGFVLRQAQGCVPMKPFSLPGIPLLNNGSTRIGPEVTCLPTTTSAPDSSDKSEGGLGLPGGLLS